MKYAIRIVGEDELPQGIHKVIVERADMPPLMLVNGELAECWRFMRAYEDTQEPCAVPSVLLPEGPLLYAV